jgi:hypothetical protein
MGCTNSNSGHGSSLTTNKEIGLSKKDAEMAKRMNESDEEQIKENIIAPQQLLSPV